MQNYNQQPPMSNVPSGQTPVGFKSAPGPNQGNYSNSKLIIIARY